MLQSLLGQVAGEMVGVRLAGGCIGPIHRTRLGAG